MKRLNAKCHWEIRRGTHKQAVDYCTKDDTRVAGPFFTGTPVLDQGESHKLKKYKVLEEIHEMIHKGAMDHELLETVGPAVSSYGKEILFMRNSFNRKLSDRKDVGVEVIVLYGDAGSGKSYAAYHTICGGFSVHRINVAGRAKQKLWFDGYTDQRTIMLDDFDHDSLYYRELLMLLDHYPYQAEVKGGFVWAVWTRVIITSNYHPVQWYTCDNSKVNNLEPLKRRIHRIYHVKDWLGKLVDWDSNDSTDGDYSAFTREVAKNEPEQIVIAEDTIPGVTAEEVDNGDVICGVYLPAPVWDSPKPPVSESDNSVYGGILNDE